MGGDLGELIIFPYCLKPNKMSGLSQTLKAIAPEPRSIILPGTLWMLERQDQNLCDKLRKIWKEKIENSQQTQESLSNLQKACQEWKVLEDSRADTISLRRKGCGSCPQMLLPALKTSSVTRGYSGFSSETKLQSLNLFPRIYT